MAFVSHFADTREIYHFFKTSEMKHILAFLIARW